MIPTFIRAYEAAAAIGGNLIVAFAAPSTGQTVTPATGATAALVGVSDQMGADAGGMCDIHRGGLVSVKLGGTVAAGAPITANAAALGIAAAPAAGATANIIGYADQPGVSGDIIDVFYAPGTIRG